jgi:branched-chain amino acid transport system ATP-binding protein
MANAAPPLLRTEDLSMHFGGVRAVEGVDFSLAEGELRCLIGPNGAGKSTFFRCLTKIYQPSAGKIFFRGLDVTSAATHEIARLGVGIKTQVPSVFDGLTVRENLMLAASAKHRGKAIESTAEAVLERLSLRSLRDTRLDRLSHGQRQWVELGIVVTSDPDLILLDEPTAGMTHAEVEHTAALIRELNKVAALVVVEHDMQFIRSIATLVTVFHQGRIFLEESAEKVLRDERVGEIYLGKGVFSR